MNSTTKRKHERTPEAGPDTPYLALAGEAGMTREQVILQLVSHIRRDQGYLAYRKASGRRTRYDDQVTSDLRALAFAVVLLDETASEVSQRAQAYTSVLRSS